MTPMTSTTRRAVTEADRRTVFADALAHLLMDAAIWATHDGTDRDAHAAILDLADRVRDHVHEMMDVLPDPTDPTPAPPTPTRAPETAGTPAVPASARLTHDDRAHAQAALLNDPIRFANVAYGALLGDASGTFDFSRLFAGDLPASSWANADEAFALIRLAARTPGFDLDRALGVARDVTNNFGDALHAQGLELGAVVEQYRQGLLAALQRGGDVDGWDAGHLADLRAALERAA